MESGGRLAGLALALLGCATGCAREPRNAADGAAMTAGPLPTGGFGAGGGLQSSGNSAASALWAPAGAPALIPVRAVLVSDDDGTRPARTSPAQIGAWVEFANRAFAPAGFELRYDGQLLPLASTVVNNASTAGDMRGVDAVLAPLLARFPGELLLLSRFGPARSPSREAFSGLILDYVVMGGFDSMSHCGHPHVDAFAHELGHFFGLAHTFASTARTVREAENALRSSGGHHGVFDGDRLADTWPDPAIVATECSADAFVTLGGVRFPLPRRNLMSYYDERDSLTGRQLELVRWVLRERLVRGMRAPKNDPAWPVEAERMAPVGPNRCSVQDMRGYRDGHWSGNAQLMCAGPAELRFSVRRRGPYRLMLYGTRAPDYVAVEVLVDGTAVGAYEGRAPLVMPTGPIPLGEGRLADGEHVRGIRPLARAGAPADGAFGIDALQLVELP
jgi:hypothetical protein